MRLLLATLLVASCTHREFTPARVYVVEPCWVHHGVHGPFRDVEVRDGDERTLVQFGNGVTSKDSSVTDDVTHCESRDYMPLVACGGETVMRFDGCRWSCRPLFELTEQKPAHVTLDLGRDIEWVMQTNLCASPNYCEGQ